MKSNEGLTGCERVRRAIEFERPDRLPVIYERFGRSDAAFIEWGQIGTGDLSQRQSVDEWGCVWQRSEQQNMGQVTGHPLIDWESARGFDWPDPDQAGLYEGMDEEARAHDGDYLLTGIFMLLFERLHSLRGFANCLTDLYTDRSRIEDLADRIVAYDLRVIDNIKAATGNRLHGFTFTDDWGTQQQLILSPDMWREFFKPRYHRIFDRLKTHGWHVWMHSCGHINVILPDLIEIGVDVINIEQPRTVGIREIGEHHRGEICFQTGCDIQATLPTGSKAAIRDEAAELLEYWADERGGFILADDGNDTALSIDPEIKRYAFEQFVELDPYRLPTR